MPDAAVAVWVPATLTALICLQAGLLLLCLLQDDGAPLSWPETLSAAFGLGVGALTFELMLMGVASIPFRLPLVLAPWPVVWAVVAVAAPWRARLWRVLRHQAIRPAERSTGGEEFVIVILLCLLAGLVVLVFAHNALFPLEGWDEWLLWDLKARAFWSDGGIKPFLANADFRGLHLDYPLLTPLAGTLLYLVLGAPHAIVQLIPAMFFLCSLVQLAAGLRRFGASTVFTVASTAVLACYPPWLYAAQVFNGEGPTLYYVLTSTIFLALYLRDERPLFLRLAAVTAGLATQARAEAILLFVAALALLLIRAIVARAWAAFVQYSAIVAVLFLPWAIASRVLTAPEGRYLNQAPDLLLNLYRLPHVLGMMVRWMLSPPHLGAFILLLPLFATLLLVRRRRVFQNWTTTYLLIAAIWALTPYVAFLTAIPEALHVDAFGRYLVVGGVLAYVFVMSELIGMSPRIKRVAFAGGVVSMTLWMGAEGLGWWKALPPPFFHHRPVESARAVLSQAETLALLTPVQRIQRLEQSYDRMGFAGLLPALVSAPLPDGEVIVFVSPTAVDGADRSYVHERLVYLLYPHRVIVINNQAALERALAASPAALVVYGQSPPLDRVAGEVTFRSGDRYAVIRAPRPKP